ncbi:hypothetical protein [Flavobacterium geliluteum]|uniref:Outer membrane protein beta-barrel domain-containing protein n=1 Tax=Flavobacterium geliluteum TaxID=2816120 RepID=A0A941AWU0_9FLAO|nr:hypothetical protein [Flavobacterium geliluteum]MBP4138250.1 hypothetical protein [Flavobacterium geliluteum]
MKKLKNIRILFFAAFTLGFITIASAQDTGESVNYDQKFKLGFGLNGGLPTDNAYDWALGGDVRLQYDLTKRASVTLTTGFTNLFMGDNVADLGFIPAKAGFKAFVWEDQFYVLGEVGAGFAVTNGYNDTTFLWAPGIGYANKHFDISLRYEDYHKFETNQVALRLAYGFEL